MAEVKTRFSIEDNISDRLVNISQHLNKLTSSMERLSNSIDNFANTGARNFAKFQNMASNNFSRLERMSNGAREKLLSDINSINQAPIKDKVFNVRANIPNIDTSINYNKPATSFRPYTISGGMLPEFDIKTPKITPHQTFMGKVTGLYKTGVGKIMGSLNKLSGIYFGARALLEASSLFFQISDKVVNIDAKLNLITNTAEVKDQLKKELQNISTSLGVSYLDFSDNAIKMRMLTGETFKSNQELVRFNELMQKMFRISGSTIDESKAAMLQLTQALAANKLQGDEYRSMLRNAPMLIEAITKQMGIPRSELKKMSSEGKITADVIKNAMFSMADDLDTKFNKLPKQWSQIGNMLKNRFIIAGESVLIFLNKLANSKVFMGLINGLCIVLQGLGIVLQGLLTVAEGVYNALSPLGGIVLDVAMACGVLYATIQLLLAITKLHVLWESISTAVTGLWSSAQVFLNTQLATTTGLIATIEALLAPFIGGAALVIVVIVAILAAIKGLQAYLNKTYKMNISYLGVLMGVITLLGACVLNVVFYICNLVVRGSKFIHNALMKLLDSVATAIKNVFVGVCQFIANVIGKAINGIKWLVEKVDSVAGTNFASKIGNVGNALANYKGNYGATHMFSNNFKFIGEEVKYIDLKDGFKFGANLGNKMTDAIKKQYKKMTSLSGGNNFSPKSLVNSLGGGTSGNVGGVGKALKNPNGAKLDRIGDNTEKLADNTEEWKEDLKLLKDMAHRDVVNSIATPTINVVVNSENHINGQDNTEFSVDKIIHNLTEKLADEVQNSLLGVVNR